MVLVGVTIGVLLLIIAIVAIILTRSVLLLQCFYYMVFSINNPRTQVSFKLGQWEHIPQITFQKRRERLTTYQQTLHQHLQMKLTAAENILTQAQKCTVHYCGVRLSNSQQQKLSLVIKENMLSACTVKSEITYFKWTDQLGYLSIKACKPVLEGNQNKCLNLIKKCLP